MIRNKMVPLSFMEIPNSTSLFIAISPLSIPGICRFNIIFLQHVAVKLI